MELVKLDIKGFRGFKNRQIISFPKDRQPIIFVGINGAGKTSILDAIVLGLQPFIDNLLDNSSKENFNLYNINIDREELSISLDWRYPNEHKDTIFQTTKRLHRAIELVDSSNKEKVKNLISDIKSNLSFAKNQYSLGIMVYYPSDRLVASPEVSDPKTQTFDHLSSMSGGESSINFQTFFRWFRLTEDIENEKRLTEDPQYTEPSLQAVKKAILAFLDNFSDLRVQRSPLVDLVVKKNGEKLSVNQLSSGEKSLLTIVGDLARRLAIANPGLPDPLKGRAVVLIDEVDLHLHPKWQKEIVQKLQHTFPNVQFVLTTHSSLVINHIKTESVFLLDDFECYPAKQTDFVTYGAELDTLLAWQGVEGGVLPETITQQLNNIAQLIQNEQLEEAKNSLSKLKAQLNPNHSEIKNIETDLEIKELGL